MDTVARAAGVSKATVSYVLSGKRRISDEVSRRVWNAVEELGYRPHSAARSLAISKTHAIGLFCSPTETLREDPYFNQLLSGILDVLERRGYRLVLYPETGEEESTYEFCLPSAQSMDGALIMNPRVDSRGLTALHRGGMPLVVIGTPGGNTDYFYVDHDQAAIMYLAAEYLIDRGHRRILFINGPPEYVGSQQREEGFVLALQEYGIEQDPLLSRHGKITLEDGERICSEAIEADVQFSAVLAMNDILAVGAIRALRLAGRDCPGDVAVVGSGDTLVAELHYPRLTSVKLYPYEQGQEAGAMVIDVIERRRLRPTHTIVPVTLVARESA
jgi:LacI family transcriptional regulator